MKVILLNPIDDHKAVKKFKKKKSLIVLCALFCFIFAGTTASAQPANESVDAVTSEDTIEYLEMAAILSLQRRMSTRRSV